MKRLCFLVAACLLMEGCATTPPPIRTPILLVGTVTNARWTDWAFDLCGYGQPVRFDDRRADAECLPHGGELYEVILKHPRRPGASDLNRGLRIAFPGHAMIWSYSEEHYVVLQPSPADFEAATGIRFVAAARDNFDSDRGCLEETGFGHLDRRHCPDKVFHKINRGRCLPVSEWLEHYDQVQHTN